MTEGIDKIDQAIEVLNRVNEADPTVLPLLIDYRVPCNRAVADDPTVQVGVHDDVWSVGVLGIVNGIVGIDTNGSGFIAAHYDDDGVLTHFVRLSAEDAR